ncbi:hypothetical protein VOLCADRAFT_90914 [Volvox carteri f. nagariensis]|uniref:Uncharacterized protein n=1 Tax=Volvox carteri f. nagariensis TaxID=3068 RepID=D8TVE5_VOLCA|nr:uncharacterized protein VOLCADRAFT_90914 [Volvox carteri f. nagariensis]EFJ48689.1 hypothetical protein VOLCADRAFT_90914 [Volvox carteri f. nagariensis]|eukprot:XP_002950488.1 hypothetical protein VOLCADRAFT_90914 [Volvox carteri f. nagariensis]
MYIACQSKCLTAAIISLYYRCSSCCLLFLLLFRHSEFSRYPALLLHNRHASSLRCVAYLRVSWFLVPSISMPRFSCEVSIARAKCAMSWRPYVSAHQMRSCDVYSAWSTTRTLITHGPDVRAPLDPHFGRHGYASPQRMSCQYTVLLPIRRCWLLPTERPCRHHGFCHSPCTRQVMRYGLCLVGNEGPINTPTRRTSTAATRRHDGYRASTPSCRLRGGAGCCRPSDRAGTTASAIHHALDRSCGMGST